MDHHIAIECLKDDLEIARTDATYLAKGIAAMMLRNSGGSERIRQDAILRWRRKLENKQQKVQALRGSIKFLEQHTTERKK